MSNSSSTTVSSSHSCSTEEIGSSSLTYDSYTTTSFSTKDAPSKLKFPSASNQSTISAISDPSTATSSSSQIHTSTMGNRPVFSPVLEETSSALEEASSSLGDPVGPVANSVSTDALDTLVRPSVDTDGVNIEITSRNPPYSPAGPSLPLECDYDVNPTELYQAIESRKWNHIEALFNNEPMRTQMQASTWVARKETNGKLRWRLLPIHAAVIFQSPALIVEKLLHECPEAAQAKDDQGMLPLHLAFRTKSTDWEAIEELVSIYPQAIFVKDRKGRTPLECGLAAANAAITSDAGKVENRPEVANRTSSLMGSLAPKQPKPSSLALTSNGRTIPPAIQKTIFSVLELYTQVSVQEQLLSAMNTSRQALEARIGAVQDSHVATLTKLKNDWENQRNELSRKIQAYRKELHNLKSDFNIQQELLEAKVKTEMELIDKLQQVTVALEAKTIMGDVVAEEVTFDITNMHSEDPREATYRIEALKKSNKELLLLLEMLLDQQSSLKLSLDKWSREAKAKDEDLKELLEKYVATSAQAAEANTSYTQEWQSRLDATSMVSKKLAQILSLSRCDSGENSPSAVDEYDGEEKKDAHDIGMHSFHTGSVGNTLSRN